MKRLVIIFLFTTNFSLSQSIADNPYNRKYITDFRKDKYMPPTTATIGMIDGISKKYEGEQEQMELVKFYKGVFDFKLIDKKILRNLIDSLISFGQTDNVKSFAKESKKAIEYRILGKIIRDFEFPDKNEKLVRLSSLSSKVVVIELWTTWCGPCIKEMKNIEDLRKANPNIEFYSISLDKSIDKMKKFVNNNNYNWPIVYGGEKNQELWSYLNIAEIPKYYIVDRERIVIDVSEKLDHEYIKTLK